MAGRSDNNQSGSPPGDSSDPEDRRPPTASGSANNSGTSDNPFSFKHFLNSDKGARPKVYCDGRTVNDLDKKPARVEYSSALPDFVQDHLVVEQCFMGATAKQRCGDSDLASQRNDFPLDLPSNRSCNVVNEVGASKSLPDFLSDGAVLSQSESNHLVSSVNVESPERECERLRRELAEQTNRVAMLSRELELARSKEHDYTKNLAKALEQVEENLERSNMRTASAESTIVQLRHEVKSLVVELNSLRLENRTLRGEEGAAGGRYDTGTDDIQSQRLAQELKAAASSAEHSLRKLLSGVDNLRIMAASLENMHRIDAKSDTFMNFDDESGPAL